MNRTTVKYIVILIFTLNCSILNDSFKDQLIPTNLAYTEETLQAYYYDLELNFALSYRFEELINLKARYSSGDQTIVQLVDKIYEAADNLNYSSPPTVTSKNKPAPSGSFNDYVSLAPYWWPSINEVGEIIYIRKDGQINPQIEEYNRDELSAFVNELALLSFAYYFSQSDVYIEKAKEYLYAWFINNDSKMNPHLKYAQFIPGKSQGRFLGIIEGNQFLFVLDSILLLKNSSLWDKDLEKGISQWFHQYLEWLVNSNFGNKERNYHNNHGSWYDVQVSRYSIILSRNHLATSVYDSVITKRIDSQILDNGEQPFELTRSNKIHYSIYNLEAIMHLAVMAKSYGYDYWNYPTSNESKLNNAIEFISNTLLTADSITNQKNFDKYSCRLQDVIENATKIINVENLQFQYYSSDCNLESKLMNYIIE